MRLRLCVQIAVLFFASLIAPTANAQGPSSRISVWDTRTSSARALSAENLANKDEWRKLARNQKSSSFQGDAVMSNGRVLAVVRKKGTAVDIYSDGSDQPVWRAQVRLQAADSESATRLERVALVENTRATASLEVEYQTSDGDSITASFRIKRGGISLETKPGRGAGLLRIEAPSRYVVLPDFFADDIVIDALKIPMAVAEIPSENFLMHMIGQGDAIAMCVFENSDQDVRLTFSGSGDRRTATGSEIRFGKDGKVWVALLEGDGIWHAVNVRTEDAGKIMPLNWRMPFVAQWRANFTRPNELTDSWEFLLRKREGAGYLKPNWISGGAQHLAEDRKRWTTVLGRFEYPCWTDDDGHGYFQPLQNKALSFEGPAIIYPINRVEQTPTDTYTVIDVMRNCLGVGPCEYILNVEGQKQDYKGRATCATRDALLAIYRNDQQKQKGNEIETALDDALTFVTHIRSRISQYVQFGHEMRRYLAKQKKAHPELAEFIAEIDKIAAEIDVRVEQRREKIRTPKFVAAMNDDFRKNLLGYDAPDAEERLTNYTQMLTEIGGNQDELVGECRWIVRSLRQRAGLVMALDPKCAEIAQAIRARCQKVLLKPSSYEAVRH